MGKPKRRQEARGHWRTTLARWKNLQGSWTGREAILFPVLLAVVAVWAYHNSFAGCFLFDDEPAILTNSALHRTWPFTGVTDFLGPRSLVTLSFVVNHALGGFSPWGYHLVNLAIHLLAGLTLYGLVRRTLLQSPLTDHSEGRASCLALTIALLWGVHPLQTESVTYVVQRAEALMGLFYLLTLYCVLRSVQAASRGWLWQVAAVGCCALGMCSKEVMATAPLVVLLYDRAFLAPSFSAALRRRWGLYAGLMVTWALLMPTAAAILPLGPPASSTASGPPPTVGFHVPGVTPLEYLRSQPGVILHYLRLTLWPSGLCLDYGWPVARTAWDIVLPTLLVAALLLASVWAWRRRPALGFCGLSFFLVLSVTSSVVPLKDPAFEHRMYLPLAALVVLAALAGEALLNVASHRLALSSHGHTLAAAGLVLGLVALLGGLTIRRNEDYRTPVAMWSDVVARRPDNVRGRNNLGNALLDQGKLAEAEFQLRQDLRLDPTYALAHYNLAKVLKARGELDQSIVHYRESLRLDPSLPPEAHYSLGNALFDHGDLAEAVEAYRTCIRGQPEFALAHYNLANALLQMGQPEEAIAEYQETLRLTPDFAPAHGNLAGALLRQGRSLEAIVHFREALRQTPHVVPVQNNLGLALVLQGEWKEAEASFRRALALEPGVAGYHRNLAFTLQRQGRAEEARAEYQASLRLDPHWPRTSLHEAWVMASDPNSAHRDGPMALLTVEQVVQATGEQDPEVLDALAAAYAEKEQFTEAATTARRALAQAREAGQTALARDIEGRIELYEHRQPFRSPTSDSERSGG